MPPRIAVFTKNRTNPAYEAARLGADRVAERFGATTTHYVPDVPDDVPQQIALIGRAIAERPDAAVLRSSTGATAWPRCRTPRCSFRCTRAR